MADQDRLIHLRLQRAHYDIGVRLERRGSVLARQVDRNDPMPARLERRYQPLKAPGAMPRTMHKSERRHSRDRENALLSAMEPQRIASRCSQRARARSTDFRHLAWPES